MARKVWKDRMGTVISEPKTLAEFVTAFNDAEFRQVIRVSLADKRKELELLKKILRRFKELLENDVRKGFEECHADITLFAPVWEATWLYFSMRPLRKARELADCVSRLEQTLGIAEAQIQTKEFKRGKFSELDVQQANSYPVEDLVNTKTLKSGKRIMACCPLHQEDTPSFVIFEDNAWHCFGCGKFGTGAIGFVMERDKIDFLSAVRNLLN